MASGVYTTSSAVSCSVRARLPSDVPLQQIAASAAAGQLDAKPARVFGFDDIREAHRVMEANKAGGKLVVVVMESRVIEIRLG